MDKVLKIVRKILGLNWKTSLAGWTLLFATLGTVAAAWKNKDFVALFTNLSSVVAIIGGIAGALGLINAKDGNITGVGPGAKQLNETTGAVEVRAEPAIPPPAPTRDSIYHP